MVTLPERFEHIQRRELVEAAQDLADWFETEHGIWATDYIETYHQQYEPDETHASVLLSPDTDEDTEFIKEVAEALEFPVELKPDTTKSNLRQLWIGSQEA